MSQALACALGVVSPHTASHTRPVVAALVCYRLHRGHLRLQPALLVTALAVLERCRLSRADGWSWLPPVTVLCNVPTPRETRDLFSFRSEWEENADTSLEVNFII